MTSPKGDGTYRSLAAAVLVAHQQTASSGCHCGGVSLGRSWAAHVAAVLDDAGALRTPTGLDPGPPSRLSDFDAGDQPFDGAAADRRLGDMRRGLPTSADVAGLWADEPEPCETCDSTGLVPIKYDIKRFRNCLDCKGTGIHPDPEPVRKDTT